MTKQQFIQELSECLLNEVDSQEYHSSIEYYSNYIETEIRKGKSEEEVTTELGSPRLIAKTIIDSQLGKESQKERVSYYERKDEDDYQKEAQKDVFRIFWNQRELKWYEKLGALLILILAIGVLLAVLGVAISLLIHVVLPIVAIIIVIRFLYELFRK